MLLPILVMDDRLAMYSRQKMAPLPVSGRQRQMKALIGRPRQNNLIV